MFFAWRGEKQSDKVKYFLQQHMQIFYIEETLLGLLGVGLGKEVVERRHG